MMSVVVSMVLPPFILVNLCQVRNTPVSLLSQDLLDVTDLFLHFAGYLFIGAFIFQPGIIGDSSGHFLGLALRFVKPSFRLVPRARLHGSPP
jgi:hypothetical protein